jgi:hypothetical protein
MIDSLEGNTTTLGCPDVTYISGTGYRPLPPKGGFYGGLFRACELFLEDFEHQVLPSFQPGAILVFNVVQQNMARATDSGWVSQWDSRTSPLDELIERGVLVTLRKSPRLAPWEGRTDDAPQLVVMVAGGKGATDELRDMADDWNHDEVFRPCTQSDVVP